MSESIILQPGEYTASTTHALTERKLDEVDYKVCRAVWAITTGRSGTAWLTDLLNHFELVKAVHEPYPGLMSWNRKAAEGQEVSPDVVRATRSRLVRSCYHHGHCYVDCSAFLSHLVPQIREAFQGSRFIHLTRDPRAFVCSAAPRQWYKLPHPQDHWWPATHPEGLDNVQRLIWWWNEVHSLGLKHERELGEFGVHRLRAEDMWSDPEAVRGLLRWLEVPPTVVERSDGLIAELQERPRNKSSLKKAEWSPEWDEFLYATAGETMRELGYE